MHDEVDRLRKARTVYIQRHQEWERCRDAARIAEQGAEIGATGENKVSKEVKMLILWELGIYKFVAAGQKKEA